MTATDRAQWLADARALLDYIEANDVPVHTHAGLEIMYHPLAGEAPDAERLAALHEIAQQIGAEVVPPSGPGRHHIARVSIGHASYEAVVVLRETHDRADAIRRLGEAALAEQEEVDAAVREVAEAVSTR